MSYWDYEEPMWEPSEADELFDEIKSKLIDAAKDSLKSDMESLKRRNEYLEKRNKELEDKSLEVSRKESDLEYKSRNLRREVEKEFYKTAIDDIFKDALEKSQLWIAYNKPHEKPKCDKCDENRKWVLTWPDGTTTSKSCTCSQPDYWYEPEETWIEALRYRSMMHITHRKDIIVSIKVINVLATADGMIILIKILGSSLYMISSVMMLLRSESNSHMVNILDLNQKKSVKNIVIG